MDSSVDGGAWVTCSVRLPSPVKMMSEVVSHFSRGVAGFIQHLHPSRLLVCVEFARLRKSGFLGGEFLDDVVNAVLGEFLRVRRETRRSR